MCARDFKRNFKLTTECGTLFLLNNPSSKQNALKFFCLDLTVKAFGERHSQTDIICTDGIPIYNGGLQLKKMNEDGVTATFGSGVNLHDASMFLRKYKRGFRTTPAYGNITIGGSTGTGSHGSTLKYNASLSSQMVGIRIVDGLGDIQDICDPEELHAFRLHLGLLGIVLTVTFYTVPLYKTQANNYFVSEEILLNGTAIKMANEADQMALYWFPEFGQVVVANWTIVDVNTKGEAYTNDHAPSIYREVSFVVATAAEAAHTLTTSTCTLASTIGTNYSQLTSDNFDRLGFLL